MTAYGLGAFIGSLVVTFLLSRLVLWLTKRMGDTAIHVFVAQFLTFAICVVLGGYGFAQNGSPRFDVALFQYWLPSAIWLAVDIVALRGRSVAASRRQPRPDAP